MSPAEFVQWAESYFTKITTAIAAEIEATIETAPPAALREVKHWLQVNKSPGQYVGVNTLYEAAGATGSSLRTFEARGGFDVQCDICGSKWSYLQGTRDVCPHCGFAYIWTYNNALAVSLGKTENAGYGEKVEAARRKWEAKLEKRPVGSSV
jgi:hypothetical protein